MNQKLVEEMQNIKEIQAPQWAIFVKTGVHKERAPVQENWWYIRTAAVLKKVQKFGPIGTNKLAKLYGGRKNRGNKPEVKYSGSRNIARKVLQQLEKSGLIEASKIEGKSGKVLTAKGKELLKKVEQ